MTDCGDDARVAALAAQIDEWLSAIAASTEEIAAVDRGTSDGTLTGDPRWYVRMLGEEKDVTTVWLTLGQRTLRYETYVMPAPEENHALLYEHLLRRNLKLFGASFAIGDEDAVFLVGQLANAHVDDDELDRILGSMYEWVEQFFRPAMRIGYASKFQA
jgi:hypothetical protein